MRDNLVATYLQEADELLADIEQSALLLESGEGVKETIDRLFRAFHTIKGSGAMCGFDAVAGFTHHLETLLDQVREGGVPVTPALADLILQAKDHIKTLLGVEQGGPPPAPGSGEVLLAALQEFAGSNLPAGEAETTQAALPVDNCPQFPERTWRIGFRPSPELLTIGGNPMALLRDLRELGPCEVTAHIDDVPTLDDIRPDICYLRWTIVLRSACDRDAIRTFFSSSKMAAS